MNEDTKFTDLSELLHDHESAVANWMEMFNRFHVAREATYKRSFAKRGEIGVWMNLARKYDRFDGIAPDVLLGSGNGVTLVDTLVDTAMYALKWIDVISKIRPNDFQEWIRTVYCKDTGLSYEEVVELYPFLNVLNDNQIVTWEEVMGKENLTAEQEGWAQCEDVKFWLSDDIDTPLHGIKRVLGDEIIEMESGHVYEAHEYKRYESLGLRPLL